MVIAERLGSVLDVNQPDRVSWQALAAVKA
jgi:hypothetical protein